MCDVDLTIKSLRCFDAFKENLRDLCHDVALLPRLTTVPVEFWSITTVRRCFETYITCEPNRGLVPTAWSIEIVVSCLLYKLLKMQIVHQTVNIMELRCTSVDGTVVFVVYTKV